MKTTSHAARRGRARLPQALVVAGVVLAATARRRAPRTEPAPAAAAARRHFPSRRHSHLAVLSGLLAVSLMISGLGVLVQRLAPTSASATVAAPASVLGGLSRIAKAEDRAGAPAEAPPPPAAPAPAPPPPPALKVKASAPDRLSVLAASLARTSRSAIRGSVVWPVNGPITGAFGERRGGHRHPGIDISAPTGTPVAAASDGTVVLAGPAPSAYSGYGVLVVIDHGNGDLTLYAHLSRVATHAGETVSAGSVIGLVGSTGHATGPHLHFEVRRGKSVIDPKAWVARRV